jgi:hypothetical protein
VFDGILNWKAGGSGLFINLRRCEATATCPKIFEANSSNEYWAKASSMAQTDSLGHDLGRVANVRYYLLASLPHGAGNGPGICAQPRNPLRPNADLRALLVDLDAWVTAGTAPPADRIPRIAMTPWHHHCPRRRRVSLGFPHWPAPPLLARRASYPSERHRLVWRRLFLKHATLSLALRSTDAG